MASHTETSSKSAPVWILGLILLAAGALPPLNHLSFPLPGNIMLDVGVTIATAGVLLILFPVVKMFYLQPLTTAIEERNANLERTFVEAEELRTRMDLMRSEYEQRLKETEAAAREQIQAQIKEAQALGQRLRAEASDKADDLIRRAREEIDSERQKVMTELRLEVVNLTLGATERLLGENMDTEKNRRLVEEFIQKAEVTG